ncbi:MAG: hypothetical protein V1672_03040, partial [Candidatus Diapherotrites archaeon]
GQTLNFSWAKPTGAPELENYWFRVYHDGDIFTEYGANLQNGFNFATKTAYNLPSDITEVVAKDGLWEWQIGGKYLGDATIHWSAKRTITKHTAAVLNTPLDNAEVSVNEFFDWDSVSGANNYVAKVTGYIQGLGAGTHYLSLGSASNFTLNQTLYNMLTGTNYTWAVAGTRLITTNPATLSQLSYTEPARTFTK